VQGGALLTAATRRALAQLQRAVLAEAAEEPDRGLNEACRRAIADLIAPHLGAPLKSLAFIDKMAAGRGP
jgi:hypothetical protein